MHKFKFAALSVELLMVLTMARAFAATYVIQPGAEGFDTCYGTVYVQNGCPDSPTLYIGGYGDTYFDFFQFDLTGSPASANTTKVELWLYGNAPNDPSLQMRRITQPWTEAGVTSATNPASTFYKYMSPVPQTAGWNVTDITDLYNGWKDGVYPNYGIELVPRSVLQTNGSIASSDNSDSTIRPKLVITYVGGNSSISVQAGWNLLGNGYSTALNVATVLGDASKVISVWKWVPTTSAWAFYSPGLSDGGAAYAASKGYDLLTTINGGEGFWLHAAAAFNVSLPTGTTILSSSFRTLSAGWNLIAVGDNFTPRQFNAALNTTPTAQGTVPLNVNSIWAWQPGQSNWYFYSPNLEAQGGSALASYETAHGYADFGAKVLDPATGFWANIPTPASDTTPPQTTVAPSVTSTTDTSTTLQVTISKSGTGYYLVQLATAVAPTTVTVLAGTSFSMTANTAASIAITGLTPTTAYTIYFVAKDTSNNVQATVWSVSITTSQSSSSQVPKYYLQQGGLIWTPTSYSQFLNWSDANAYCQNNTIIGKTGWRLPTLTELTAFNAAYSAGTLTAQWSLMDQLNSPWQGSWTWSSTPDYSTIFQGIYQAVSLGNPLAVFNVTSIPDSIPVNVTCVHS